MATKKDKFKKILTHGPAYCQKHDKMKVLSGWDYVPMGQPPILYCPNCKKERDAYFEEQAKNLPDICAADD